MRAGREALWEFKNPAETVLFHIQYPKKRHLICFTQKKFDSSSLFFLGGGLHSFSVIKSVTDGHSIVRSWVRLHAILAVST